MYKRMASFEIVSERCPALRPGRDAPGAVDRNGNQLTVAERTATLRQQLRPKWPVRMLLSILAQGARVGHDQPNPFALGERQDRPGRVGVIRLQQVARASPERLVVAQMVR